MNKSATFALLLLLCVPALSQGAADPAPEGNDPVTKTLVWPDGTRYVGGVVDGKRSGKGTIFWQDGTRFVGQFENDMRNGPGTMILPDGTVYTGFFRNDELVDTQSTITASTAEAMGMDEDSTVQALGDTELPMEADGISTRPATDDSTETTPTTMAQADTSTVEPEPQSSVAAPAEEAPAEEAPAAIEDGDDSSLLTSTEEYSLEDPYSSDVTEVTPQVEDELRETVELWAAAWQDQNVPQYLANYAEDFVVPGRQSRRTWEALRRTRLNRPSFIKLDVDFQRFEFVETNVVDVFFRQAYRSNTYSDLTDKVLRMKKEGTDWKILIERSR